MFFSTEKIEIQRVGIRPWRAPNGKTGIYGNAWEWRQEHFKFFLSSSTKIGSSFTLEYDESANFYAI